MKRDLVIAAFSGLVVGGAAWFLVGLGGNLALWVSALVRFGCFN